MKARHFIIPAMILLAACQQMEVENPNAKESKEPAAEAEKTAILTVEATKGEADTKGLNLDGSRLDSYWKAGEVVKVFKGGSSLGTLTVAPGSGEKPVDATLSGEINVAGLAVNDQLTLLYPRDTWDYTGQVGTLAGIESNQAFAVATVTVASISGTGTGTVTTTDKASFDNQQSIYRFGFKSGGSYFEIKDFTVSATSGQLVQSISWKSSAWTPTFGSITVTPASRPGDDLYYVALRNESTAADTYSFTITGSDDALYLATQAIPASALDAPGKFLGAKQISATKTTLAPMSSGVISTSSEVY